MRDRLDDIRGRGAELVIVGNGAASFAEAFREDFELDCPLLVDPDLVAYRAAGLRRGRVELLSPRLPLNALRAMREGYRQSSVEGDPWQLGGVFVIRAGGTLTYRYVSEVAGDHPPVEEVIEALGDDAPPLATDPGASAIEAWLGRGLSRLVDPTIALSFSRPGFRIHALAFDPEDLEVDLSDQRCLVTGANAGLGFETALALADLGAEVELLCRNPERGEEAAERIRQQTGNRRVRVEVVDLSSLESVRGAAERLGERPVDVLIHNAGFLPDARQESADGHEITFATHVLGPHLLTRLLLPALEQAPAARVVWVSSGGMYTRKLTLKDVDWRKRPYDGVIAYAETKRAQVVLSELWAEELRDTTVTVNAMHPGWAETPGVRGSLPRFYRLTREILRSPAEGADTIVWLAASARAGDSTGLFFFDREPRRTHFLPFTRETADDRQELWTLCEKLCSG
ncbi:MAG: SDR family NAD(P)-dependent oxidoreductase [Myxococcota bacterium]|nr:SDR family NAD(P)-dependent oxidoreductase [Myxococcota bacterium]